MIEASIEKVWGLVRPGTFSWWGLMESSTAAESDAVGATSVQTYKDGSKLTVKLLEMSVPGSKKQETPRAEFAAILRAAELSPAPSTVLSRTTDWRLACLGPGPLLDVGAGSVGKDKE